MDRRPRTRVESQVLVNVDQILEHLGLGLELIGVRVRLLDLWEHQGDDVMLLQRFEEEVLILVLFGGLAERGVEDILFDLGMDLQLVLDRLERALPLPPSASSSFESNSRTVL